MHSLLRRAVSKLIKFLDKALELPPEPKDIDDGASYRLVMEPEAKALIDDYEQFKEEKPTKPDIPKPLKGSLAERLAKEQNQ